MHIRTEYTEIVHLKIEPAVHTAALGRAHLRAHRTGPLHTVSLGAAAAFDSTSWRGIPVVAHGSSGLAGAEHF